MNSLSSKTGLRFSRLFVLLSLSVFALFSVFQFGVFAEEGASQSYPYSKNFTITAYYSPLPCQDRYVTGSYEGDKRLNGNGTNGADGTPVYPGMIAAPSSYPFGMKVNIPGIGITAVHDRGGAIVDANSNHFDRLDIWMGYGDKGLKRALNWGRRNVSATVYGFDSNIKEHVIFTNFSMSEAIPKTCAVVPTINEEVVSKEVIVSDNKESANPEISVDIVTPPVNKVEAVVDDVKTISVDLPLIKSSYASSYSVDDAVITTGLLMTPMSLGSVGNDVRELQRGLSTLNYYRGPITGYYGELTEHAVFKFQQSRGIVVDELSAGAGVVGPVTLSTLNGFLATANYTKAVVAQASFSNAFIASTEHSSGSLSHELDFGMEDKDVALLQTFLIDGGYLSSSFVTNYFGKKTQSALLAFQLDHGIIDDAQSLGAGRLGPATLETINSLS